VVVLVCAFLNLYRLPVIIEDGVIADPSGIVVEGVHVGKEAVLGANVCLTASTKIDVTGETPWKGYVPARQL
jgi:2,3,4,5-tetrahydropyridine-2-carboxylate N-succinyltransferase